jgi:hypothetical protein
MENGFKQPVDMGWLMIQQMRGSITTLTWNSVPEMRAFYVLLKVSLNNEQSRHQRELVTASEPTETYHRNQRSACIIQQAFLWSRRKAVSYPATDLIDAVVWPGRITRTGKSVSGFIYDARYQHIVERLTISNNKDGYHQFRMPDWLIDQVGSPYSKNNKCWIHKLVFRLQWDRWPECRVDHTYGKQDNRAGSVRLITAGGNARNRQKPKADGLPWGVCWVDHVGKYHAQSTDRSGARKNLGYYKDIEAAAAACDLYNAELIKEDVRLSDLMTRGIIDPPKSTLPKNIRQRGRNKFAVIINIGKRQVYLGQFNSIALASAAHEAARIVRDAGGTVEEMKQAALKATALSSTNGGA